MDLIMFVISDVRGLADDYLDRVKILNTAPIGTTGTDGNLSIYALNKHILIENRKGITMKLAISFSNWDN